MVATLRKQQVVPTTAERGCEPQPFQPQDYSETIHEWLNRPFLKQKVRAFPFQKRTLKLKTRRKIQQDDEQLALCPLRPGSAILASVADDCLCDDVTLVSGTFVSRVFSGADYKALPDWILDMERWVKAATGVAYDHEIDDDRFLIHYPPKSNSIRCCYAVIFVKID